MLRTPALLALALGLAACGDCDCCKQKPGPSETTTAATAEPTPEATDVPPTVAAAWRGEGATLELSVWHMRCAGCEKKIEDTLAALDGVSGVTASAKDSRVVVTLAKAETRESLKPRIREALAAQDFRVLGE
jgi:copper chaperone CopZ